MKCRFWLAGLLFSLTACEANTLSQSENKSSVSEKPTAPVVKSETVEKGVKAVPQAKPFRGTVRYFQLEGGFLGIVTDRGLQILPTNLEKQYHQDGAEIEFTGVFVKDMVTIQQWGRPFRLTRVELIKPGKPITRNESAF